MKEAKEKKRPRADRIHHEITVHDWEGFKKTWKGTNFLPELNSLSDQEKEGQLIERLYELAGEKNKACYLFPNSLKQDLRQMLIRLVESDNFSDLLSYQYESLYMGKPKQLLIFRKISSLILYLEKYRLPTEYKELQTGVNKILVELEKLQIVQNLMISEENEEKIGEIREKIKEFKEEAQEKMKKYWNLMDEIMFDFKKQKMKTTLTFLNIKHSLCPEIKKLAIEHELYFFYRFLNISQYDQHKDLNILKKNPPKQEEYYGDEQEEKVQNVVLQKEVDKPKEKQFPPNEILLQIKKVTENGAICEVEFENDAKRKVEQVIVTIHKPKTQLQQKYMKVIDVQADDWDQFTVILDPLCPGFCEYALKGKNKSGQSDWSYIQVWNQVLPDSQNQQGIYKINKRDYDFYGLGNSEYGLIPEEDVSSTNDEWMKMKLKGVDFSASTQISICNSAGDVGSWGSLFVSEDDEEDEEENKKVNFVKVNMPKYRIYTPCLILQKEKIRKVSCGQGYSLMVDYLGKVWSYGVNDAGQLGLDHTDSSIDTTEPAKIPMFIKQKIFIVDVVASYFGASFAIDNQGKGYRWGTNQMQMTEFPIKDTYKNIINFEYSENLLNKIPTPQPIGNKTISSPIKSIHPGVQFVFALTQTNELYGWGKCQYLGMGEMLNSHFGNIFFICNPIPILKNIKKVSTGTKHTLALNDKGELLGWGKSEYFSESSSKFWKEPQVVRKYEGFFESGPEYTVLEEKGSLRIIGDKKNFKKGIYEMPKGKMVKVMGSEGMVMIMVDNTI